MYECMGPWRPEEGIRSLELELLVAVPSSLTEVLRSVLSLQHVPITAELSPALKHFSKCTSFQLQHELCMNVETPCTGLLVSL